MFPFPENVPTNKTHVAFVDKVIWYCSEPPPTRSTSSSLLPSGLSFALSSFGVLLLEFHPELRIQVQVGYREGRGRWGPEGKGPAGVSMIR